MTRFRTENSTYLIEDGYLSRIDSSHELRRDGEPLRIIETLNPPTVGEPARFLVDVLQDGHTQTLRATSPVVSVDELDECPGFAYCGNLTYAEEDCEACQKEYADAMTRWAEDSSYYRYG